MRYFCKRWYKEIIVYTIFVNNGVQYYCICYFHKHWYTV